MSTFAPDFLPRRGNRGQNRRLLLSIINPLNMVWFTSVQIPPRHTNEGQKFYNYVRINKER